MVVAKLSSAALVAAIACLFCCDAGAKAHVSPSDPQSTSAQQSQPPQKTAINAPAISARDQSLIDSVEKAYQTGLSNYRDGHIDAAKSNFDYAVDMILRSGIDIKSDPAISEERS